MKTKNLLKKAFLLLALMGGATSAWADDIIYSMTSPTAPSGDLASGTTETVTATFSPSGSSAQVYNGKSSAAIMVQSSQIKLGGSGNSWFRAILATGQAIAEGDVITTSDESKTYYIGATSTKGDAVSITFPYTVPAASALIGATNVYVWKNGGSAFSSFTITRITGIAKPQIAIDGSSVTMTCATADATIYYTTDGSEPTTSSATYSSAITLTNSTTVRAFAKKGDDASDIVKKDCYVTHATALAVLGYNGGTVSGDVWTSTDGTYTLTNNVESRGINYVNLAGSQDGFKLNHTDSYTIQPSSNIKITKIVVVGKTWLQGSAGNASTIAFDGFTPASGTFFDYLTDGETYIKTIEFTPSSELNFGDPVVMRPGTNQIGAYLEIYGEEKIKSKTFDYSTSAGKSNYASWTISPVTIATNATGVDGSNNFLKGDDLTATISAADGYIVSKVVFTYTASNRVSETTTASDGTAVTTDGATQTWTNSAGKKSVQFTFASCRLTKMVVTYLPCVSKEITSAGWATFCSPYALDFSDVEGLTAYIVTGTVGETTELDLTEVTSVPANTGVLLEGTAGDYTIPVAASSSTNVTANKLVGVIDSDVLTAEAGFVLMGSPKVGFYKNNKNFTLTANTAYLPANFAGGETTARSAYFFGGDITGVANVEAAAEATLKDGKFFKDGKLFIFKNGKKFNAAGQIVK